MKDKKLTKSQLTIPDLLYKYRFVTVNQLQKYFNHKDPHRIKEWLKILEEKKYIYRIKSNDPTIAHVFCLDTKARQLFKEDEDMNQAFLGRLYKEKGLTDIFKSHCMLLFDIYLYFKSQQEEDSTIQFFNQHELKDYDCFPDELPDAYIAVETKEGTNRYFLDLYDEYRNKPFLPRRRIKQYITYSEEGKWQTNTDNSPFPVILFILPNEKTKKHIYHYGKAILENSLENLELFVTTVSNIQTNEDLNIWLEIA